MLYARARLRYLAALGLPALATPVFACSGGGGGTNTTPTATPTASETPSVTATASETTPVATATATATATAAPTATATATAAVSSAWVPDKDPRPQPKEPKGMHLPSCPNGLVCVQQPASLGGAEAAPAPYAACAAHTELPNDGPLAGRGVSTTFHPATTAQERKKNPAACCYEWVRLCPGGRPLRGAEGDIVAEATGRSDWLAAIGDIDVASRVSAADRGSAAAHFAREAAFEHASIAAFSRVALGLLGLGAPAELLAETHAAALDEVEHARVAFALSSAFGGEARGPARLGVDKLAPLPASLAELATETFVDACLGETVAALALREAAAGTDERVIAGLLSGIADDEERHAALAWRTVAWTLREGGVAVRDALAAAMEAVRAEMEEAVGSARGPVGEGERTPGGATRGPVGEGGKALGGVASADLRACGILDAGALREVRVRAIREVVLPCAAALLASAERGARGAAAHEDSMDAAASSRGRFGEVGGAVR